MAECMRHVQSGSHRLQSLPSYAVESVGHTGIPVYLIPNTGVHLQTWHKRIGTEVRKSSIWFGRMMHGLHGLHWVLSLDALCKSCTGLHWA